MEFNLCTVIVTVLVLGMAILFVPKTYPCVFHDAYGYLAELVKRVREKKPAPPENAAGGKEAVMVNGTANYTK